MKHRAPAPPKPKKRRRGRGEGAVYEVEGGFEVVVSLGNHPGTGKRIRRKKTARTKGEALTKLAKLQASPSASASDRTTLAQWLRRWLEDVARPAVKPKTLASYTSVIEGHLIPGLGAVALGSLTPVHVQAFFSTAAKAKAPSRQMQIALVVLRQALDNARRMGLVVHNVCADVDAPKHKKKRAHALTGPEARALLAVVAKDFPLSSSLFVLALDTGARQGEIFGAQWSDMDLDVDPAVWRVEHNLIALSKTEVAKRAAAGEGACVAPDLLLTDTPKTEDGRRVIDLSESCRVEMLAHRSRSGGAAGFVFVGDRGGPLRNSNFARRVLDPAVVTAKLERITFHELRHTTATLLLEAGVPPHVVSARLGHKDVATTLRIYAHVLRRMSLKAAKTAGDIFGPSGA